MSESNFPDTADEGGDLTSVLQFLIRSGQVRVITSDYSGLYHVDSDDDYYDPYDSPPSSCMYDYNVHAGSQSPDTSLIDKSDFKSQVLRDGAGWPKLKNTLHKDENLPHCLLKREIGKCAQQGFSSTEKCLIGSRYLPNQKVRCMPFGNKIFCGTFSNDGNSFMCAAQDAVIRIYDSQNDRLTLAKTIAARDVGWSVLDCSFSPNGNFCAYSSWSECLHVCNVTGPHEVHEALPLIPVNRRFCVFSLSYSDDGRELIGGACDESIYIYDLVAKKRISRIQSHEDDVNCVVFSDETSQILFSGGDDGLCKVWDRRTLNETSPKPVGILAGHSDGITFIDSKNDGRHLITNSKDQTIKLWDIRIFSSQEGQEATRQAVSRQSWDYRFQKVPKKLIGTKKRTIGDTSLMTYSGHTVLQTLIRCRFSPKFTTGQKYIYTGCASGSVVVYDALTGQIVTTLSHHSGCVRDASWHPYNMTLMSSGWDGDIVKWNYRETIDDSDDDSMSGDSSDSELFGSINYCGLRRSKRLACYHSRKS